MRDLKANIVIEQSEAQVPVILIDDVVTHKVGLWYAVEDKPG
jgi:hypothetical protein